MEEIKNFLIYANSFDAHEFSHYIAALSMPAHFEEKFDYFCKTQGGGTAGLIRFYSYLGNDDARILLTAMKTSKHYPK